MLEIKKLAHNLVKSFADASASTGLMALGLIYFHTFAMLPFLWVYFATIFALHFAIAIIADGVKGKI